MGTPSAARGRRYRRERAAHLAAFPICQVDDCGEVADSTDHEPPLAFHVHVPGSGCCRLLSTTMKHQRKQGADITNGKLRRIPPPSRAW